MSYKLRLMVVSSIAVGIFLGTMPKDGFAANWYCCQSKSDGHHFWVSSMIGCESKGADQDTNTNDCSGAPTEN